MAEKACSHIWAVASPISDVTSLGVFAVVGIVFFCTKCLALEQRRWG